MAAAATTPPVLTGERPVEEIVVPVGDGPLPVRALELAAALAGRWGLPVRLLHATGHDPVVATDPELAAARTSLADRAPDLDVRVEALAGDDPAAAVAAIVDATALTVVATEQADAWSFKHSVAETLVDRLRGPLVLVGPSARPPSLDGADVVAALDGSGAGQAALSASAALARSLGGTLRLLRVVPEPTPGAPADTADADRSDAGRPDNGVADELRHLADRIEPPVAVTWEIVHGNDPIGAIETVADGTGAEFVVVASRGRTDETRTTMASTTMGLVARAERPVLVVHADRRRQDPPADR
ncbi:MAG: universal stress protein [Actinomycetota bacterium]